jgi:NAD/NADP transhydrogenase alpha subunit
MELSSSFAIFVMAIFVGYYVVWSVTRRSHAADGGDRTPSAR